VPVLERWSAARTKTLYSRDRFVAINRSISVKKSFIAHATIRTRDKCLDVGGTESDMNWDAIAAVSDAVGAIAVVVSLLYLSTQIRHGTKTAEDSAFRDIFATLTGHIDTMIEPPNREVILKGLSDYQSLAGEEKFTFDGVFVMLVTLVESTVISNAAELVKDETMENFGFYLRTRYFAYQGARDWWNDSKAIYIPELQTWFDQMIAKADPNSDFWGIKVPPNQ